MKRKRVIVNDESYLLGYTNGFIMWVLDNSKVTDNEDIANAFFDFLDYCDDKKLDQELVYLWLAVALEARVINPRDHIDKLFEAKTNTDVIYSYKNPEIKLTEIFLLFDGILERFEVRRKGKGRT